MKNLQDQETIKTTITSDTINLKYTIYQNFDKNLINRVVDHEGKKKSAYQDSLGYWTIGIGRLIDKRKNAGLSEDEMFYLLNNDLMSCKFQLMPYSFFQVQDKVRQDVLIELCFNLGFGGLLSFGTFLNYMKLKNYDGAVVDLKKTLWATQVHETRVNDICYRIENGQYKNA